MEAIAIDIPLQSTAALALVQTRFGRLIVVAVTTIGLPGVCVLSSAEGLEDADSLEWLQQRDCEVVQDRLLSDAVDTCRFAHRLPALHCVDAKDHSTHPGHA